MDNPVHRRDEVPLGDVTSSADYDDDKDDVAAMFFHRNSEKKRNT